MLSYYVLLPWFWRKATALAQNTAIWGLRLICILQYYYNQCTEFDHQDDVVRHGSTKYLPNALYCDRQQDYEAQFSDVYDQ